MPLVSAIIPAYNGATRYLEQAIGSVLAQTCQDLELIVVDDASTDETARLVLQFPQARYFKRPENGGQAAARNDGARLAGGAYLAFLDQDDLWAPSFIEETLASLQTRPEVAVVHCDGYQVNERDEPLHYDAAMKQGQTITQLLRGGHDVATSGSLFRKTCFDAVGGYDDTLAVWEDIDLAIRLYQRFPLLHLPKPLYRHRLYTRNVSRDIPSERALTGRRRFLEKHAPSCPPRTQLAKALARDWAHYYGDLGKHHFEKRRIDEARCAFWLSLQQRPFNHKVWLRLLRTYLIRSVQTRPAPSRHTP
ncbi:MAG: glycosyltransferase family 2 protein [Nitrospirae bacterium]|nr:MAG: glycosyltransferase family 2 protein [Nitrospirota bacterium]